MPVQIGGHRNINEQVPLQNKTEVKPNTQVEQVKNNDAVASPNPTLTKQPSQSTVAPSSRRESIADIKSEVDSTIDSNNDPVQTLNQRASQIFAMSPVTQSPVAPPSNLNPKDAQLLSTTNDDAKLGQIQDNGQVMRQLLKPNTDKLIKELDGSILKDKVNKKAEAFGANLVKNNSDQGAVMQLQLKSTDEIRETVAGAVFEAKDKYSLTQYNSKKSEYDIAKASKEELTVLRKNVDKAYPPMGATEEQKALHQEAKNKYLEKVKEVNPEFYATLAPDTKVMPQVSNVIKVPAEPKIYDYLPKNKQKLVDSITDGITSELSKNTVSSTLSVSDLPPNESQRLNRYMNEAKTAKAVAQINLTIPQEITFNGKKYTYDGLLGGGGDGVAFAMKSADNEKIVVKSQMMDAEADSPSELTNDSFKKELNPHIDMMGNPANPNVLSLKGIIKNGDEILSVTEYAKGGEMNDVTDKINNAKANNLVSPENEKLLKTLMIKDGLQGLQYMHTEKNMTHYDVKPKNFFVGDNGQVKLADFGRAVNGRGESEGQPSAAYFPPEGSTKPGEKIDTFAMGITIAETFKGNNPYVTNNTSYLAGGSLITGNEPEDHIINAMTNLDAAQRPNLTSVLETSFFNNPTVNNDAVKQKAGQLLEAVMSNDNESISRLNNELSVAVASTKINP